MPRDGFASEVEFSPRERGCARRDAGLRPAGLRFPRVSGDAPNEQANAKLEVMFSPRERGCAPGAQQLRKDQDVFPA